MDRVKHHILAPVALRMARDHVPTPANHHLLDIGPHPRAIRLDLRDQAAVIVIQHRLRHSTKEGKGMHVPVHPGLRRGRR